MALPPANPDSDSYIGQLLLEQPADWWLPEGYTLTPTMSVPMSVTDPAGKGRYIYTVPGYRPPPRRVKSIAEIIQKELGPIPAQGIGPDARELLGMNRNDALGLINRIIMAPVDLGVALLDLANYGISATIVGATEGVARAGWLNESDAGDLRRDLLLLSFVIGMEAGRSAGAVSAERRSAQLRVLTMAQSAARSLPPVILRVENAASGFGRWFRTVDVVEADVAVGTGQARSLNGWLARVREGRKFDASQALNYRFNQIYLVKNSGSGYWILDSYGPRRPGFGAGPVSRKFTQLADVQINSAVAMLREAHRKYRPGTTFADVPSRPLDMRDRTVQGQLWLEVPVQVKLVPAEILATAQQLGIKIRDTSGKVY